jgi:hypothetical protein
MPGQPKYTRPTIWLGYAFLVGFALFVAMQLIATKRNVDDVAELAKSYISYSTFTPDKPEYRPGDLVRFTFTRTAEKSPEVDSYPLLLLIVDSFENQDTGEVFSGILGSRIVHESGTETLHALRRLPEWATPGTYVLEGYSSTQTNRPTRATFYTSSPFKVIK